MARVLWIDGRCGAAGDMIVAALLDAGVPLAPLRAALRSLPLEGWSLRATRVDRAGIAARRIHVRVRGAQPARRRRDVERIVSGGDLPSDVRDLALAIFSRLFAAEAIVHGSRPDRVHLHEAGAADAIVDIVGAAYALRHLAAERIVVSPLATGGGSIDCAHGRYPVPGPAVLEIVRGLPLHGGESEFEQLTPTGAAILATVADAWGALPAMRPLTIGYGAGAHDPPGAPNVLRVVLGEEGAGEPIAGATLGEVLVLQCVLDDVPPQTIAFACGRLLDAGAIDAYALPATMKKGRPGHELTVLARPDALETLSRVVLEETGSLGVRYRLERRVELERVSIRVRTRFGSVRVKVGSLAGRELRAWPEYDDCARHATERGVPLGAVQRAALEAYAATKTGRRRGAGAPSRRKVGQGKRKRRGGSGE